MRFANVLALNVVALSCATPVLAQVTINNSPSGPTSPGIVSDAYYETNVTDHSTNPTTFSLVSQATPNAQFNTNSTENSGSNAGAPFASANVTAANVTATIGNSNGLIDSQGLVGYSFQVVVNANVAGVNFVPSQYVTLDLTGVTSASGSGIFYAHSYIRFEDSFGGLIGDPFSSCAAGSGLLPDSTPVQNNCNPTNTTFNDKFGTASYSGNAGVSGTLTFTFPVNVVQDMTISAEVWTYDDASYGTASVDPTITIDPNTPNAQNYMVTQSSNLTVPEPSSLGLLATALSAAAAIGRRRRRA